MRNRIRFAGVCISLLLGVSPLSHANLGEDPVAVSTDSNYQEGVKAVSAQDWNKAIELLTKAVQSEPKNADAHNLLAFSHRKKGNFDSSFAHYEEALKLNPGHKPAHEYIGEAYLQTDNLPKAEQHLAILAKLCSPIPCDEYKQLKRAVEDYKKAKK
jgi:tetratricopeptide (TPR) repeat protein